MLIVISPAKTLDFESPSPLKKFTQPQFLEHSQQLINTLRDFNPEQIGQLMAISPQLSALNWQRNLNWSLPFTHKNAKSALFAFRGDVYTGLDADSFSRSDVDYAQKHLRILSGLYGLLKPLDLIQPYRLEMGTTLANARGKNLYEFWNDRITVALNAELTTQRRPLLINLASEEYFKAVRPKHLAAPVLTLHFKERKGRDFKVVSFYAKKARGLMSAYIVRNRIHNVAAIKDFASAGYQYNAALSREYDWIFTREEAQEETREETPDKPIAT